MKKKNWVRASGPVSVGQSGKGKQNLFYFWPNAKRNFRLGMSLWRYLASDKLLHARNIFMFYKSWKCNIIKLDQNTYMHNNLSNYTYTGESLYKALFGIHRSGPCCKWIVL